MIAASALSECQAPPSFLLTIHSRKTGQNTARSVSREWRDAGALELTVETHSTAINDFAEADSRARCPKARQRNRAGGRLTLPRSPRRR
jgi:hypothetical protein